MYRITNYSGGRKRRKEKIMEAIIKGYFVKNTMITKKDGDNIDCAIVLTGDETVQINKCNFDCKPLTPVELNVNIKSTQYGLYITPVVS